MRNLVHNALKFTERGPGRAWRARRLDAGDVAIMVADTGCGIPPEALGYVFEMFRQVPGSGGGGVGLGLHIVRRLVEALGGARDGQRARSATAPASPWCCRTRSRTTPRWSSERTRPS